MHVTSGMRSCDTPVVVQIIAACAQCATPPLFYARSKCWVPHIGGVACHVSYKWCATIS
jgi:hypothetical protein